MEFRRMWGRRVFGGGSLKRRWFFGFFFISGFCSLVYEVVWLRLSMAKFGVTTPMVSIVLSVFMAGLGLGSWAGGRFIRRFDARPPASRCGSTERWSC